MSVELIKLHDDVIFIYCNWISTRWQWSVNLYKNREETAIYRRRINTKTQNTQNRKHTKQGNIHKKSVKNRKSIN